MINKQHAMYQLISMLDDIIMYCDEDPDAINDYILQMHFYFQQMKEATESNNRALTPEQFNKIRVTTIGLLQDQINKLNSPDSYRIRYF